MPSITYTAEQIADIIFRKENRITVPKETKGDASGAFDAKASPEMDMSLIAAWQELKSIGFTDRHINAFTSALVTLSQSAADEKAQGIIFEEQENRVVHFLNIGFDPALFLGLSITGMKMDEIMTRNVVEQIYSAFVTDVDGAAQDVPELLIIQSVEPSLKNKPTVT